MSSHVLTHSELIPFDNAAAGHDGVLSDPSGSLIIKPCTSTEISFYESVLVRSPELAVFMPVYMGTLALSPEKSPTEALTAAAAESASSTSTPADLNFDSQQTIKGKKLSTNLSIVLSNVAAGFKRPNVLDVKLGARLWDDDVRPEKRARLDKVSRETTSGSSGFRIAGMRVWRGDKEGKKEEEVMRRAGSIRDVKEDGRSESDEQFVREEEGGYEVYDKNYGRTLTSLTIRSGFEAFFPTHSGITRDLRTEIVQRFLRDVHILRRTLEGLETRMYSASILFVYEGDAEALRSAIDEERRGAGKLRMKGEDEEEEGEEEERLGGDDGGEENEHGRVREGRTEENEDEDDDDDDDEGPKVCACKLIDFAHASWTPGLGADENMLQGVKSVAKILDDMIKT